MPESAVQPKAKRTYTTPEELERYQGMIDKVFKRNTGKDHTYYRPVVIYPQFTSVTAEDLVDVEDDNGEKIQAYQYVVRFNVENYVEEVIATSGKRIVQKKPVGSFNVDAEEFLLKFSLSDSGSKPAKP